MTLYLQSLKTNIRKACYLDNFMLTFAIWYTLPLKVQCINFPLRFCMKNKLPFLRHFVLLFNKDDLFQFGPSYDLDEDILVFFSPVFSLAYFVEKDYTESKYTSIPESMWWAIQTMTSVSTGEGVVSTSVSRGGSLNYALNRVFSPNQMNLWLYF